MGLRLSPTPFRQWRKDELPARVEIESWETDDDIWIRKWGQFWNIRDFCTVGCPVIPLPRGGAQTAAGEFMIAGYDGEVWGVHSTARYRMGPFGRELICE